MRPNKGETFFGHGEYVYTYSEKSPCHFDHRYAIVFIFFLQTPRPAGHRTKLDRVSSAGLVFSTTHILTIMAAPGPGSRTPCISCLYFNPLLLEFLRLVPSVPLESPQRPVGETPFLVNLRSSTSP